MGTTLGPSQEMKRQQETFTYAFFFLFVLFFQLISDAYNDPGFIE